MALTKPPPWACAHLSGRWGSLPSPANPGNQDFAARKDRENANPVWAG